MKRKIAVAAIAVSLFSPMVQAGDVELQLGATRFNSLPCGLWERSCYGAYQREQHMKSGYLRLGGDWRVSQHVEINAFAYTVGRYHTEAFAPGHEGCAAAHGTGARDVCGPTAKYATSGGWSGVGLTQSLKANAFGADWSIETGLTYNRQWFTLGVTCNGNNGGQPDLDFHGTAYGIGQVLGLGVDGRRLGLRLYRYTSGADGKFNDAQYPSGVGKAYVGAVSFRF